LLLIWVLADLPPVEFYLSPGVIGRKKVDILHQPTAAAFINNLDYYTPISITERHNDWPEFALPILLPRDDSRDDAHGPSGNVAPLDTSVMHCRL